jgi:two-component system NtrC family response regulator
MACVLIIDDDTRMGRVLEKLLCRMGHRAVLTHTLEQGLGKVRKKEMDAVFLDVNLPDGNGIDVISEIRKTPSALKLCSLRDSGMARALA